MEEVWLETPYPLRFFYHSLIKAAVGLLHAGRHNKHGAAVKLGDAVRLLSLFQPAYLGVRTDLLLKGSEEWHHRVTVEGPVDWEALDLMAAPQIDTVGSILPPSA